MQPPVLLEFQPSEDLPDDSYADCPSAWVPPKSAASGSTVGSNDLYALSRFDDSSDYDIYNFTRELISDFLQDVSIKVVGTSMNHMGFLVPLAQQEEML